MDEEGERGGASVELPASVSSCVVVMAEEGGRGGASDEQPANIFARYLRECILLLALQVVTVTYVAGLNPPGGVWPETKGGHLTGNPIFAVTNHVRYNAFSYSNTAALVLSGAVVLILLFVRGQNTAGPFWFLFVLRSVMSLGMLVLAVAYVAGASRQKFTTNYASASVAILFICDVIFTCIWIYCKKQESLDLDAARARFNAIYVMSMAYTAGLSPPGAFWLDTQEGHLAGDPALAVYHQSRFKAFFVGNTMAFVGSLFIIPMVLTGVNPGGNWLFFCNAVAVNGLWIAYAAGSCIDNAYIAYVVLSGLVILPVTAVMFVMFDMCWRIKEAVKQLLKKCLPNW